MRSTTWSPVAGWYDSLVGRGGHYYHQHVIFPALKKILLPQNGESVLDAGCGQGVYARFLTSGVRYTGVDISASLVKAAKKADHNPLHTYHVADFTKDPGVGINKYDHAVSLLALQNMDNAASAIRYLAEAVKPGGDVTLVLNHPCFRVPRQSGWGKEEKAKLDYRWINRYLSPLKIPVSAHPGDPGSAVTWSFHQPLSYYFDALEESNCVVTKFLELVSDKTSQGKAAKAENRARAEFPLFVLIQARKVKEV